MKYCTKCGKQLPDEAAFCSGCGNAVGNPIPTANAAPTGTAAPYAQPAPNNAAPYAQQPAPNGAAPYAQPAPYYAQQPKPESPSMVYAGMVCAFLMPLVGLICGLVGMSKYTNPQLKQKSKGVMLLSLGMWIIYFFIIMVMMQL